MLSNTYQPRLKMDKLQTLEEIASLLGDMFKQDTDLPPIAYETEGKTAEQVRYEIDMLSADTEERVAYLNGKISELDAWLNRPTELTLQEVSQQADVISGLNNTRR